jgi:ABC-type phosphate/phosphonate transport system substrate-binding protein
MSAIAFLPMYAVRGARDHADTLWNHLRDSLRANGFEAPGEVSTIAPRIDGWLHPNLILGQTCGLPYITRLCDRVELVGTPDYGVEGCAPGFYHSTLVVSAIDRRQHLSEFLGSTFAVNARSGRFFGRAIHTGSHDASMRLVANGLADIAAIDSVTWRISRTFDAETSGLRSIGTTESTPGLPFIVARRLFDGGLSDAVRAGIATLPGGTRAAFGLRGLVPFRRADYEVIRTNLVAAEAAHSLPELEEMPALPS